MDPPTLAQCANVPNELHYDIILRSDSSPIGKRKGDSSFKKKIPKGKKKNTCAAESGGELIFNSTFLFHHQLGLAFPNFYFIILSHLELIFSEI